MTRRLFIFSFSCVVALCLLVLLMRWSNAAATPPTASSNSCVPNPIPQEANGNVYFTPPGQVLSQTIDDTRAIAWGDVDNDNDPDLIIGNYGQANILYFNDGTGHFPISQTIGTGNDNTTSLAFGLINNDTHLDLVVGNNGQPNVIYFNNGSGEFPTTAVFGTGTDATYALALGDANGDPFLDIAVGNYGQQNRLYLNDGTGQFPTIVNFGTGTDATRALAWGDVDDDDDLDLVVGNFAQQNRVYINSGAGNFPTFVNFGTGSDDTVSLDMGDVNGDGFLDIAIANSHYAERPTIYINNGTGQFSTSIPVLSRQNSAIKLADVDNDNDLDVALSTTIKQGSNAVFLNRNGFAVYQGRYFAESTAGETYAIALADADGDGDLDIAVGNRNAPDTVVFNQQKNSPSLYITSTILFEDSGGTPTVLKPSYPTQGGFLYFSILQENNTFYLWVSNWSNASGAVSREERLQSQDGLIWSNRTTTNLVDSTPDSNYLYGFSSILKNGATYEAWEEYYHVSVNGMWVQTVRYITSNDGLNWTIVNQPSLSSARDVAVLKNNGLYHMWAGPDVDYATTGTQSGRYRTSNAGGTGWGDWQTGGALIQVNGDETYYRRVVRLLPDGSYEMFYFYGTVINRAVSVNGSQFTIEDTAILDLADILPDFYYLTDFEVVKVNGEDWFYFSYLDLNNVSHLRVARPATISGLTANNDSPTILGDSTQLTATVSAGTNISYSWAFGDGSYGCGPNHITHTYPTVGTYTAIVTATNAYNVVTTTTTVQVVDVPVSGLAAANDSPTIISNPTHLSATVSGGTNVQYTWAFGDGSYGSGANPTHTYSAVGNYTAIVTATNTNNSLSTTTPVQVIDVAVSGLVAANDSPTLLGNITHLSATVTGGTNIQYTWAFGDGTYGSGASPTHVYPTVGNYTAIVTATNSNNSQSASTLVTIESGITYAYLPLLSSCEATPIWADIALVIDTSGSMADPTEPGGVSKLVAAQTAAATFLTFLDFTNQRDQASLVSFDNIATLEHPLSRNEATLLTAINNLQLGSLTRMDLGLQIARLELTGVRHDPDNQTAIIFLTDGHPNGTTEAEVLAQALLAKNAGITIFTIGLGSGVNSSLLQAVASTPAYYYPSPSTGDLNAIYQQIASSLACR